MPRHRDKTVRRISAAKRREKEIGSFKKDAVEAYIKKITNDGKRKNSKFISSEIHKEVEALKKVRV